MVLFSRTVIARALGVAAIPLAIGVLIVTAIVGLIATMAVLGAGMPCLLIDDIRNRLRKAGRD